MGGGYYGGLRYYGKRSADAEADPYLLYGRGLGYAGYYGHGLGYYGHGLGYYGGLRHYGYGLGHLGYYGHHGLGYAYYGKRSADAEPEAKADPYYLGYGLGYAGHLGYYGHGLGYGYGRFYYGK